jgi:hypothetical protein
LRGVLLAPESESARTGDRHGVRADESLTDAPAPTNAPGSVTNAPGDAAPGVTTAAVFIAATALLSDVVVLSTRRVDLSHTG